MKSLNIHPSPEVPTSSLSSPHPETSMKDVDLSTVNDLEELHMESHHDDIEKLPQHYLTSPPVQNTNLRPKSNFNPVHKKGPYIQTFYKVVYSDFVNMCQSQFQKNNNQTHPL